MRTLSFKCQATGKKQFRTCYFFIVLADTVVLYIWVKQIGFQIKEL